MRLLFIRIENFGKLTDFEYKFRTGFNEISEANGFGKTTLITFIRVMFFGFSGEGRRQAYDNERMRYMPWNKGVYGGTINFYHEGRNYELTRTFGEKKSLDTFSLLDADTLLPVSDYSDNIGNEIFHIDEDTFLRLLYFSEGDIDSNVNGVISRRVCDDTKEYIDIDNYEHAESVLKDILNRMSPKRKTGEIYKLSDEVTSLKRRCIERNELCERLDNLKNELSKVDEEIKTLEDSIFAYRRRIETRNSNIDNENKKSNRGILSVALIMLTLGVISMIFAFSLGIGTMVVIGGLIATLLGLFLMILSINRIGFTSKNGQWDKGAEKEQKELFLKEDMIVEKTKKEGELKKEISELLMRIEREKDVSKLYDEALKKKEELTLKYSRLEKTREILRKSKENINMRYLGPIKASFSKYYEIITGESAIGYEIDAELNVHFREFGSLHEKDFLSAGLKDAVALAMRFALIDAIFPSEELFIILDDPFINLDSEKKVGATKLLEEVSSTHQIIYVCKN